MRNLPVTAFKLVLNYGLNGEQAALSREGNTYYVIKGIYNMMTCYLSTHYLNFNFQNKRKNVCIFYFSKMKDSVSFFLT